MKRIYVIVGITIIVITAMITVSLIYKQEGMRNCDRNKKRNHNMSPKYKVDMDDYILKTNIIPPVCPACPSVSGRDKPCPACPPCGRCPEQNFECKKVQTGINEVPILGPTFDDFGNF
jgi:hypothetical protein